MHKRRLIVGFAALLTVLFICFVNPYLDYVRMCLFHPKGFIKWF